MSKLSFPTSADLVARRRKKHRQQIDELLASVAKALGNVHPTDSEVRIRAPSANVMNIAVAELKEQLDMGFIVQGLAVPQHFSTISIHDFDKNTQISEYYVIVRW